MCRIQWYLEYFSKSLCVYFSSIFIATQSDLKKKKNLPSFLCLERVCPLFYDLFVPKSDSHLLAFYVCFNIFLPGSHFLTMYSFSQFNDEKKLMGFHQNLEDVTEDQLSLASIHYMRSHYQEAIDIYKRLLLQNRSVPFNLLNQFKSLLLQLGACATLAPP